MDSQQKHDSNERRAYVKPTIVKVGLRPEEAVLAACKNAVSAGQNIGVGATCASPVACSTQAS